MDLKNTFEYAMKKEVERNLLAKKSKKLKASDLKPIDKKFNVSVTLDALEQKMLVEITDGGVIIYKDWLHTGGLFENSYYLESLAYKIQHVKKGYTISDNTVADENYEDEDYDDED